MVVSLSKFLLLLPTLAQVLESGTPHEAGLSDDGKAGCIVRSVHTEWNMVRDIGEGGRPALRALTPEEEVSPQNDKADRRGGMFLRSVGAEAGVCAGAPDGNAARAHRRAFAVGVCAARAHRELFLRPSG